MKHFLVAAISVITLVTFATSAVACPGCNDCKRDHNKVCADECKIKDLKESTTCDKGCLKEKCASECEKCKEAAESSAACADDKAATKHGIAPGGCVQTPKETDPKETEPKDQKKD